MGKINNRIIEFRIRIKLKTIPKENYGVRSIQVHLYVIVAI